MKKIVSIVLYALLAIAVVPMLLWMFGFFGPFQQPVDAFGGADVMLLIAVIYLALALVVLVGMAIMNMGKGKGNSRLSLFVFGGLAVVAVIIYFTMAQSAVVYGADGTAFDNVTTLKLTDAGLYLAYIAMGITVVALLWGAVRKALK